MPTDIKFEELTPEQQEAYLARGEYKDPAALDQGNAPKGAPSGPVATTDESVGQPDPLAEEPAPKPKQSRKRTS